MIKLIGLLGAKGSGKDTAAKLLISDYGFVRTSFATALYEQVAQAYLVSVEFLENRETKETPMLKLQLNNCADENFVAVAMEFLTKQNIESCVPGWVPSILQAPFKAAGYAKAAMRRNYEKSAARSPRWTLQVWGTEYRRRSTFGHDTYWLDKVAAQIAANPATKFVITDVRFYNEANFVEQTARGILGRIRRPLLEAKEAEARKAGKLTALHPSETELLARKVNFELINRENEPESLREGLSVLFSELEKAA